MRAVLLAAVAGVAIGLAAFTFSYAEGLSYFSADPKACANCHIMQRQYDGWQKASHHAVASCVDCHLPHSFFAKYLAKASNGWHHSKGFTLQDFHEPILIKPRNAEILQQSCLRCHGDFVHDALVTGARPQGARSVEDGRCVHCHRGVGHGARG